MHIKRQTSKHTPSRSTTAAAMEAADSSHQPWPARSSQRPAPSACSHQQQQQQHNYNYSMFANRPARPRIAHR
jgi:hypothetical protein